MKNNKTWFQMLLKWYDSVIKIPETSEKVKHCLRLCEIQTEDVIKFNENLDYRDLFIGIYFVTELYIFDHDREFIEIENEEYKKMHEIFVEILIENDCVMLSKERSEGNAEKYAELRNKYSIKQPKYISWDRGSFVAI